MFGHSAVWIFDEENGINEVYNYGTFDYDAPNFLLNFLKGKMLYWLGEDDGGRYLYVYNHYKIGVKENVLLLDHNEKNELRNALKENARLENREYLYDFYFDNCSTRIFDMLDDLFGPISYTGEKGKSFRDLLHEYMDGLDWTQFGIDLIVGADSDQTATVRQQMFLPEYLSSILETATMEDGQKLMNNSVTILNHPWPERKSFWITPLILFTILLLIEIVILRYRWNNKWTRSLDNLWMILMATSSVIMMVMWWGTDHQSCANNYNLIVFSPLIILWLIMKFMKVKSLKWISLLIIVPYLLLPFIKMGVQNLHGAVMLIALITVLKIFRNGDLKSLRRFV